MSEYRDQYDDTPAGVIKYVAAARGWNPSVAYAKAVAYAEINTPSWEGFISDEWRASQLLRLAELVEEIDQPGSDKLAFAIRQRGAAVETADYDWTGRLQSVATDVSTDVRTTAGSAFRGLQLLGPLVLGVAILYAFGRK